MDSRAIQLNNSIGSDWFRLLIDFVKEKFKKYKFKTPNDANGLAGGCAVLIDLWRNAECIELNFF